MTETEYKGIGIRFVAQLVDWIILSIIYVIIGFGMFGTLTWQVTGPAAGSIVGVNLVIWFLYFVVLEGSAGATLGKRVAGIRVVKEDGAKCGFGAAIIRNILRIIDGLPFIYIIGMILISRSDKKQRLGDSVAKTVVVSAKQPLTIPTLPTEQAAGKFCIECGAKMTDVATFCPKCGAQQ